MKSGVGLYDPRLMVVRPASQSNPDQEPAFLSLDEPVIIKGKYPNTEALDPEDLMRFISLPAQELDRGNSYRHLDHG